MLVHIDPTYEAKESSWRPSDGHSKVLRNVGNTANFYSVLPPKTRIHIKI
jgi:hypothetical protein